MTIGTHPGRFFCLFLLLSFSLSFGLSVAGCRRARPGTQPSAAVQRLPHLGTIEIDDVSATGAALDVGATVNAVRQALYKNELVDPAITDAGLEDSAVLRVKGRVGVEIAEVRAKGIVRSGVSLQLSTRPSEIPAAVNEELSAGGEQPFEVNQDVDRRRITQRLVERTIADLIAGFARRLHLTAATASAIHAAITNATDPLREEAIRVAGTRGLRDEVPTLLTLLQDDNESVRDAALGALIVLRERRAVTELTRNRSLRDRHEMRKILEAIAILGGEEAGDYLSFVAESHDDQEIRKLAAEAKIRLDRHAPAPDPR